MEVISGSRDGLINWGDDTSAFGILSMLEAPPSPDGRWPSSDSKHRASSAVVEGPFRTKDKQEEFDNQNLNKVVPALSRH